LFLCTALQLRRREPGVWSLDVNDAIRTRNMEAAMRFIAGMKLPEPFTK
jgi:hypothetical protein